MAGKVLALGLGLSGCLMSGGGDGRRSANLAETGLVGGYTLADYRFEYGNGLVQNPSSLMLSGTLVFAADSGYVEQILVGGVPPAYETKGKITRVWINGSGNSQGEVDLTLDEGDSTQFGSSRFSFHSDTLQLITTVSKIRDPAKVGYTETAYWLRDP